MDTSNTWATKGVLDHTGHFDEYKETVTRLFPALSRDYIDTRSISKTDALASAYFLKCYPREVVVLDIGTFVGVSVFHFASQPKVHKVISVDPNFGMVEEIRDKSDMLSSSIDAEPLGSLKVLDVARAALAEFDDEQKKVQLCVGPVGTSQVSPQGGSLGSLEKIDTSALEPSSGESLIAFVNGPHTKEGVRADLEAIFEKAPRAIVLLDACRGSWGPFAQAGAVSFMEQTQGKYHFQLFGDLGPSVASSSLGIVYPDAKAAEVRQTLVEFSELFTQRLDLLRLLRREEELIEAVSSYKDTADGLRDENEILAKRASQLEERNSTLEERNSTLEERNSKLKERSSKLEERSSKLEERNSKLKERNSQVLAHYSSRRYKLVDTLWKGMLRVPGKGRLARRKPAR